MKDVKPQYGKCKECGTNLEKYNAKYELCNDCFIKDAQKTIDRSQKLAEQRQKKRREQIWKQQMESERNHQKKLSEDEAEAELIYQESQLNEAYGYFIKWTNYCAKYDLLDVSLGFLFQMGANKIPVPEKKMTLSEVSEYIRTLTAPTFDEELQANAVNWGYVYLIYAPIVKKYKIGYSNNPERRVNDLTASLPSEMKAELKHKILTDDMPRLEKWFHEVLIEYNHDGEWFALNDIQVDEFKSLEKVMFQLLHHKKWLTSREETLKSGEPNFEIIREMKRQLKLL